MSFLLQFRRLFSSNEGASLVETALTVPFLLVLLLGAIDFGRAYYMDMEIEGAAQAAAAYGSSNPADTTGMQSAATSDAPNVPGLTVSTATYGCECSDGSSYSASCSAIPTCSGTNSVYVVKETVSATYRPWFPWPGIPSSMVLSRSASMRSNGN